MSKTSLSAGLMLERVGDDLLVLVRGSESVKLSGDAARYVELLSRGEEAEASVDTVNSLVSAGVVQAGRGWSRRSVVTGGAVAVGAGVFSLALPTVAAASSVVSLTGTWVWVDEYAFYQSIDDDIGLENPTWTRDFVVNLLEPFTQPSGEPSSLSALGQEIPLSSRDDRSLTFLVSATPGVARPKVEPLTGNITGEFTWGGVTYTVTFTQGEDIVVRPG